MVHANPGATPRGVHLAKVTKELGIDAALKDKLTYSNALDGGVQKITRRSRYRHLSAERGDLGEGHRAGRDCCRRRCRA